MEEETLVSSGHVTTQNRGGKGGKGWHNALIVAVVILVGFLGLLKDQSADEDFCIIFSLSSKEDVLSQR